MRRFRNACLRILLILCLVLIVALTGLAWFGSEHIVSPPRRALQGYHQEILAEPARFGLSITSFTSAGDTPCMLVQPAFSPKPAHKSRQLRAGLRRRGMRPPQWGDLRGTVILLHGHSGRKEDHLPICERFVAAGFRCLLPDLPGHGDHPSSIATFGKNEGQLIEDLLEDAGVTFGFPDQPAFLFGVSQGGAIAIQTAARNPQRWTAIATAAAFSSLDQPILKSAQSFHPKLRPLAPINTFAVGCGTWCRSGMWPADISPRDAARGISQPVMIIHGKEDRFIGIDQGLEIYDALPSPSKIFRPVDNAGHGRVLAEDADNLYPEICIFFLQALDGTIASTF